MASKHILPKEELNIRLDICRDCESFLPRLERCAECGCFLQIKARFRVFNCPVNKWPGDPANPEEDVPAG